MMLTPRGYWRWYMGFDAEDRLILALIAIDGLLIVGIIIAIIVRNV